jgi:hypothetical protein
MVLKIQIKKKYISRNTAVYDVPIPRELSKAAGFPQCSLTLLDGEC